MKHTWIAYTVTAVIAAGAGAAIAGLPSTPEGADLIVTALPSTTTLPPTTTAPLPAPTTTAPATSVSASPVTSLPPTIGGTSTTTTTTTAVAATTTTLTLAERSALTVGVANATDQSGVAGAAADALLTLGYVDVSTRDATQSETSTVYFVEGLDAEAARLAVDAGLDATAIAPYDEAPDLVTPGEFQLLLVIGLDRV